jgi:hypothetical protein
VSNSPLFVITNDPQVLPFSQVFEALFNTAFAAD